MKKNSFFITLALLLYSNIIYAHDPKNISTVPSFVEIKFEHLDFKESKQKTAGNRATITLQHQIDKHCLKGAYEVAQTHTKQPPLTEDLRVNKLYLLYTYHLSEQHLFNVGYITLQDNLVPTDGAKVYSLGYTYELTKTNNMNVTAYYSHYDIFDAYQTDLRYQQNNYINGLMISFILEGKYINIHDCQSPFCANAEKDYFTPGIRLKAIKNGYFLHGGAYFGKRAFAVMNDGFMLQHHAMEFSQTYMIGIGKRWKDFAVKFRYLSQKAEELPLKNSGVGVNNIAGAVMYYF